MPWANPSSDGGVVHARTGEPKTVCLDLLLLGRSRNACGHAFRSRLDQGEKMVDILLGHEVVKHVTGPPIHGVACRNQSLVVLHEFAVPDDQFAVVPYLFDLVSKEA